MRLFPPCCQNLFRLVAAFTIVASLAAAAVAQGGEATPANTADGAVPLSIRRYAARLVARYDRNGDAMLQAEEWQQMHGQPARADSDHDQVITVDELSDWIAAYAARHRLRVATPPTEAREAASSPASKESAESANADAASSTQEAAAASRAEAAEGLEERHDTRFHVPAKRLPPGLPDWFRRRDSDGDGQLTLSEFAPKATAAEEQEFAAHDLNGDGVITPKEVLKASKPRAKP